MNRRRGDVLGGGNSEYKGEGACCDMIWCAMT